MKTIKYKAISNNGAGTTTFTLEDAIRGKVSFMYPEHWEFLRFVDLKDKNGKDICEGDIIEDSSGDRGVVEYMRTKEARFEAAGESGDLLHFTDSDTEIIGNINENPKPIK